MKRSLNVQSICVCALLFAGQHVLLAQAATVCPAYQPPTGPNLAQNPDFETVGPCGPLTLWSANIGNCGVNSAAANWTIHSDNSGGYVDTVLQQSTLPIGGKAKMIHILSQGNESGIWQPLPSGLTTIMLTAWVNVSRGHVLVQATAGLTGPAAWSTKTNEWEELRVCTNGNVPVDHILIWNEDPNGSDFLVDRVEVHAVVQPIPVVLQGAVPLRAFPAEEAVALPSRRLASQRRVSAE